MVQTKRMIKVQGSLMYLIVKQFILYSLYFVIIQSLHKHSQVNVLIALLVLECVF